MRQLSIVLIVVTFLLWCLLAGCTTSTKYSLRADNDYFSPSNQDKNYTQGIRVSGEVPDSSGTHEYYAQQLFYTPYHKKTLEVLPGERPYAGYAAAGYKANWSRSGTLVDILGVEIGVVGPHAYAKETQREFHKLLGQSYPAGWDTQLHDRGIVNLTAERKHRTLFSGSDFISTVGANFGNLFDQGYLSGTLRVGHNLGADFYNVDTIFPRLAHDPWSYYWFATVLGRAVAYNVFLDGLNKEEFVGEGRIGFSVKYENFSLGYTLVKMTKEFETEKQGMDFGEIKLGVGW